MSDTDANRGKRHGSEEVAGELVVAGRDATPVVQLVEEALDQVSLSVSLEIDAANDAHVALAWNVSGGPEGGEQLDDAARAIAMVCNRLARRTQTWIRLGNVVLSEACPGLSTKRTGSPTASTTAWILVVNPPRERPMA